jgi:phospho-N-acetylmuramoyl-pentapeptide-transferase
MGGIIIIVSVLLSVVMWGDLGNKYVLIMIAAITGFGMIGLMDDYLKAVRHNSKGLRGWYKFGLQIVLALIIRRYILLPAR